MAFKDRVAADREGCKSPLWGRAKRASGANCIQSNLIESSQGGRKRALSFGPAHSRCHTLEQLGGSCFWPPSCSGNCTRAAKVASGGCSISLCWAHLHTNQRPNRRSTLFSFLRSVGIWRFFSKNWKELLSALRLERKRAER